MSYFPAATARQIRGYLERHELDHAHWSYVLVLSPVQAIFLAFDELEVLC